MGGCGGGGGSGLWGWLIHFFFWRFWFLSCWGGGSGGSFRYYRNSRVRLDSWTREKRKKGGRRERGNSPSGVLK